ncbi:sugar transferase [Eubacterium sp. AM05-23]|uniref:sugar transferase n=1 Tax=Eubacterium TaxID=1730 RepID=UPI000E49BDFB|nr:MULTISPECIES: sugar transferase [Eubacterium]RHO57207.1 sugar transferase [Eubacterium sp. AM05-23]
MKKWEDLPVEIQLPEVREYYDILAKKKGSLFLKRVYDIVVSFVLLVLLSPVIILLSTAIKLDSRGSVFYRQERYTQYGRKFKIHKFRSMCDGADKKGSLVTVGNDARITRVGKLVRKCRLDEIAQLIDVFKGDMTFVGVRPEVKKYVDKYKNEWLATFLLPAGITNLTCIYFKDEDELLSGVEDVDKEYAEKILPIKMKWNLKGIKEFSFWNDIKLMFMTFFAVCGKEYKENE